MILFVLPAYNEEENLSTLLDKISSTMSEASLNFQIIVVNDGSRDRTLEIAMSRRYVHVVNHKVNMGLHVAIFDGLKYASVLCRSGDVVVTMDADNTHEPSHVKPMLDRISNGYDIVIASRYEKGGEEIGLSFKRKFLSRAINAMLGIACPMKGARDYTCGFRAYKCEVLKKAFEHYGNALIEFKSFVCMAEILIKMRRLGVSVCEVPLVLRYDQKKGSSKMKLGKTISNYLTLIARNMI